MHRESGLSDGFALMIDIRSDLDRGHKGVVQGSVHIPRTVLEWRIAPESPWRNPHLGGLDRQLVLLCDHGYSSSLATATLVELGLDATDVIGGFEAWKDPGLPSRLTIICVAYYVRVARDQDLPYEPSARAHDEPEAAVLGDVLAEDLARFAIADVVVEWSAGVGHLSGSVVAPGRVEEGGVRSCSRPRIVAGDVRWPRCGACPRARAPAVPVAREGVQHLAVTVEENDAVCRAAGGYGWRR